MVRTIAAIVLAALLPLGAALAQESEDALDFGGDAFRAGGSVAFAAPGARDVFLAGERVDLAAAVEGSAHLAGRRVATEGAVGGDLYAFGADVRVAGPVAGAASLAGYDVEVLGAIGGNLRATGSRIDLRGPVGGAALIAGDAVEIAAAITGDASVTADTLTFAEGARVDGRLTLFEPEGVTFDVPASVAPPERIERQVSHDGPMMGRMVGHSWIAVIAGLVLGVLVLAALATLTATLAPRGVERLRAIVGDGPFRALGAGFLAQSALIGGAIVLAATLIGIVLAPFAMLAAVAARSARLRRRGLPARGLGGDAGRRARARHLPGIRARGLVGAVLATLLGLAAAAGLVRVAGADLRGRRGDRDGDVRPPLRVNARRQHACCAKSSHCN